MSDLPKPPRFDNRISTGNWLTIAGGVLVALGAWFTLQADFRALAQRVDRGESRDDETNRTLTTLSGAVIRIETEQKAIRAEAERQSRQLDRIEGLLRNGNSRGTP